MILVDSGPLIALLDAGDQHHQSCRETLKSLRPPLLTVWPVLVEAMYLLDEYRAQEALWEMMLREVVAVVPIGLADFRAMRDLMEKYRSLPMDLADAALVHVAARDGIHTIFTLDRRDFSVYRVRRKPLRIVP